jgi:3-hydroxyisobutyrate dehydrogenase-like beta-hydroxyacid dehydrogenase
MLSIAMLGVGEAAGALLEGWDRRGCRRIAIFDIKARHPATKSWVAGRCVDLDVMNCATPANALHDADLVLSLVTADQALAVATEAAPHLTQGALYVDGNSCSPETKRQAARQVDAAGGRYVDMAIMAPIYPRRHLTPVMLAGPDAPVAKRALAGLGMQPQVVGPDIGQASTIKMVRSVMIKGMEALTAECMLAARRAGVLDAVLESLMASDPGIDWRERSAYNLERMMVHGTRRAAEMREVAGTVEHLGLPARLSRAVAEWQAELGRLGLAAGEDDVTARADRILAVLADRR